MSSVNVGAKRSLLKAWEKLLEVNSNKDVKGLTDLLDENIIWNYLDGSTIIGREAYVKVPEEAWEVMPDYTVKSKEERIEVSDSGDLGYLIGEHYSVANDTGEELGRWKHIFVWKKVDGDWKVTAVSMNGKPVEAS